MEYKRGHPGNIAIDYRTTILHKVHNHIKLSYPFCSNTQFLLLALLLFKLGGFQGRNLPTAFDEPGIYCDTNKRLDKNFRYEICEPFGKRVF